MISTIVRDFVTNTTKSFESIVYDLVDVIEKSGHKLDCSIKWKNLTFAKNENFHHWLCSISITKKFVGLNFHFGGLLEDPNNLFTTGTSKFLRKLEFKDTAEIKSDVINDFLNQAVNKLQYFIDNWKEIQKTK